MNTCEQCGQPREQVRCEDCDGYGGSWVDLGDGEDYWQPCGRCAGQGQRLVCRNQTCPSWRWYVANGAEHAIAERATRKVGGQA